MIAAGDAGGVDEITYFGHVVQARAGLEARECALHGGACLMLGADLAVTHLNYKAEYDSKNETTVFPIARAGVDVGTRHVRVRLGMEAGGLRRLQQINLAAALAYQF